MDRFGSARWLEGTSVYASPFRSVLEQKANWRVMRTLRLKHYAL
jgi:hypothetical protein